MSENGNAYFNYSVLKISKSYKESQHGSINATLCSSDTYFQVLCGHEEK